MIFMSATFLSQAHETDRGKARVQVSRCRYNTAKGKRLTGVHLHEGGHGVGHTPLGHVLAAPVAADRQECDACMCVFVAVDSFLLSSQMLDLCDLKHSIILANAIMHSYLSSFFTPWL